MCVRAHGCTLPLRSTDNEKKHKPLVLLEVKLCYFGAIHTLSLKVRAMNDFILISLNFFQGTPHLPSNHLSFDTTSLDDGPHPLE